MMIALSNGYHVGKVNDLAPTNSCNSEAEAACGIDMNLPIRYPTWRIITGLVSG